MLGSNQIPLKFTKHFYLFLDVYILFWNECAVHNDWNSEFMHEMWKSVPFIGLYSLAFND